MYRWRRLVAYAFAISCVAVPAAAAEQRPQDGLDVYTVDTTAEQLAAFEEKGLDVAESRVTASGVKAQMILTDSQAKDVRAEGAKAKLTRVKGGKTVKQFAAAQAAERLHRLAVVRRAGRLPRPDVRARAQLPAGHQARQDRHDAPGPRDPRAQGDAGRPRPARRQRPAVLFSATQHAREWIATEIDRRLMYHYIDGWANDDPQIKDLLKGTELWFVPVMNPDGYQYTFTHERLWRKNLRDNDGDGQTTNADGVDPNRNYPEHFKYDEEGSSKIQSSQTYRGPGPAPSPRRRRSWACRTGCGFAFNVNYHSNGRWLLYPEGWQTGSPTADDPIYYALSGNLDKPAIEGFHPGLSSDVLYVTNGEANDYLHKRAARWPGPRS